MTPNDTPVEKSLLGSPTPPLSKIEVTVSTCPDPDSEGADPGNQVSVVIIKEGGYDVESEE